VGIVCGHGIVEVGLDRVKLVDVLGLNLLNPQVTEEIDKCSLGGHGSNQKGREEREKTGEKEKEGFFEKSDRWNFFFFFDRWNYFSSSSFLFFSFLFFFF